MGTVIRFPTLEQGTRGGRLPEAKSPSAAVIILPVIRIERYPDDWLPLIYRGNAQLRLFGWTPEVEKDFDRLLELKPDHPEAHLSVAIIMSHRGLFREALPHFHLYGADICLSARDKGKASYAFQGYCVHNTNQLLRLPEEFYQCYHYLKAKWRKFLPIYTSCIKVSRLNGDLYSRRLHEIGETALGKSKRPMLRVGDPRPFASEIPAELTEQL